MDFIKDNLVFAHLSAQDSTGVISQLADALYRNGNVNGDYKQAVLDREKVYPTGLPSGDICVAVPHTDVKYVKSPAIVFATLDQPVKFANMADKSQTVDARIVTMLAMKEPHSQVQLLQNLMQLFQNQDLLKKLLKLDSSAKLYDELVAYFK
ncbi:PTS sugar transporter subunit IIA [uncultured Limosilactobacillus sp.]|uniref:PTS sugar transporter subunit IIA n=1 Tax=uncultured Limosilactobacillus sp. TaxID=2837629 RepID=UPI0025DB2D49|nr:PTS sugar transporter subunit IIA [uncultured Limosilactobacillus sp.]